MTSTIKSLKKQIMAISLLVQLMRETRNVKKYELKIHFLINSNTQNVDNDNIKNSSNLNEK